MTVCKRLHLICLVEFWMCFSKEFIFSKFAGFTKHELYHMFCLILKLSLWYIHFCIFNIYVKLFSWNKSQWLLRLLFSYLKADWSYLKVNKSWYIAWFVVSRFIKKLFSSDFVNIYLFSIFFLIVVINIYLFSIFF